MGIHKWITLRNRLNNFLEDHETKITCHEVSNLTKHAQGFQFKIRN